MTECIQETFRFAAHFSRRVEVGFTAGQVSSDGGALLLRQVDGKINLLDRLASCFVDGRSPRLVTHPVSTMLAQRIYGLALGYEDLNDHEQLRADPLFGLLLSGKRKLEEPLAGKSTLNRLELVGRTWRYHKIGYSSRAIDRLLVDLFLESLDPPPVEIVLDLDATDIPLSGHQPERFFHGYYDSYCYLPLYIFAGDQLLSARLRPANRDAAAGSVEEVSPIVRQVRERWPEVRIVLRADSGFCREELMSWCEQNRVDYLFGLQRNQRLRRIIGKQMHQAQLEHKDTAKAARVFTEFDYQTRQSWSRSRRVVAKSEYLDKGENPRFVVTSLAAEEWGRRTYMRSSTAPVARWRIASRNRCACSPTGSPATK
jgi:Transposase DDE domain group 1